MKILAVASEIYSQSLGNQSITGLAVMVRDVYNKVSEQCDCYLLSSNYYLASEEISKSLHILNSKNRNWYVNVSIFDFIKAAYIFGVDKKAIKHYVKKTAVLRTQTKSFLYHIERIHPDIVNFHEFDDLNTSLVKLCRKKNIKCVITNHLYIGHARGCDAYAYLKRNEKTLLTMKNLHISVISTGMKKRMLTDYPLLNSDFVHVTIDGTNFVGTNTNMTEKRCQEKKILLCIGNVMERKNQKQLIRSLSLLDVEIRKNIEVWFLGNDRNESVNKWIAECKCGDIAYYKGKVRSEQMPEFYSKAFATITTSLCEGFGLTMIEGYSYGVPAILPADIDSFEDIFDERCSVAIKGWSDKDIVDAIRTCVNKEWNMDIIKVKAQDYNMDSVGLDYVNMYNKIFGKN